MLVFYGIGLIKFILRKYYHCHGQNSMSISFHLSFLHINDVGESKISGSDVWLSISMMYQ